MIVKIPLANMYGPDAELICDQLLYGWSVKPVTVTERLGLVEAPMRSVGYVNLGDFTGKRYEANRRICTLCASAYREPSFKSAEVLTLFMGSLVKATAYEKDGFCEIEGTNGDCFYVHSKSLEPITHAFDADKIVRCAKLFLGAPYKWGGKTVLGVDCSGLVAMCYSACGIELYRDSDPDMQNGERVSLDELERADLVYLKGHVGLYVGKGIVVHASWKEGKVLYTTLEEFMSISQPVCAIRIKA